MSAGRPLLVIVTGPPASGKTSIAGEIARALDIPAVHKDTFKERLAGEIPGSGLDWSRQLGRAAYAMVFQVGEILVRSGTDVLLEANFHPELSLPYLGPIAERAEVVQVVCGGQPEELYRRYLDRHATGLRHHVHIDPDERWLEGLRDSVRRDHRLHLPGPVIRCDTTTGQPLDVEDVIDQISSHRAGLRA